MSKSTHAIRLPYDDPATLREMHHDCRAASSHLHLSASRGTILDARHEPIRWTVPDSAARMADAIHLHLS